MASNPITLGFDIASVGILPNYKEPEAQPFPKPKDVTFDAGYGATTDDLQRGYLDPNIKQLPEYDKDNYANMYGQEPRAIKEDTADFEFRNRDRESKGFLTRPRIPTER